MSFKILLKTLNMLNVLQNFLMFIDFKRDLYTNLVAAETPIIELAATVLSILIIIQSGVGLVSWLMIRQPALYEARVASLYMRAKTTDFKITAFKKCKLIMIDCLFLKRVPQNLIVHLITSLLGFTVTTYAYAVGKFNFFIKKQLLCVLLIFPIQRTLLWDLLL